MRYHFTSEGCSVTLARMKANMPFLILLVILSVACSSSGSQSTNRVTRQTELCSPLISTSVDTECMYNGQRVACNEPMKPNTTVSPRCKMFYKEIYLREYSRIVCLESGEWSNRLPYCAPDCGLTSSPGTLVPLILHGSPTHQGEFPWVAAIYLKFKDDRWEQGCIGTLISPHIVLTAAHCVMSEIDGRLTTPEDVKVGLGKYYRDYYKNESSSVISDVREIIVPRFYAGRASSYALDIAIIDLKTSVQVTAFIMPACVDWTSSITVNSGTMGQIAGWGYTENDAPSDTLLSANMSYIDNGQCIKNVRKVFQGLITHDKFCATSINGSAVGRVDSGLGLTIVSNGQHFILGVASTKITQERELSLFTDVSNREHRTWLEEQKDRLNRLHSES